MKHIENEELRDEHLPKSGCSWQKVVKFASTYDPYTAPDTRIPNGIENLNIQTASINQIRLALYSEWRRFNHMQVNPSPSEMRSIYLAINILREKIQ